MYSKKVLKFFKEPKNVGKIDNPDGVGKVGNIVCGDVMYLYIKVGKDKTGNEIIKDIKFQTFGCVAAISTSSAITELAKGKDIIEATKINKDRVIKYLGSLPSVKIHCSLLATDALNEAVFDYLKKQKRKIPPELEKRHQRIQKEKEIIEKKYKEWVTTEEKILSQKN